MAKEYKNGYNDKIQYHTDQAEMWETKAKAALKKGDAVFYEDFCSRREQSLESVNFFFNKQAKLDEESKPYSKKWGNVNWYKENKKVPVTFTNPRNETEPYNEGLYGPRIMTGWIKGMFGVPNAGIFDVRSGMIDYEVNPMEDSNFRLVSYDEIENSII